MAGYETTITNPELAGENVAGPEETQQAVRVLPDPKPADKHGWWWGTGRRKAAVARVRFRPAYFIKLWGKRLALTDGVI